MHHITSVIPLLATLLPVLYASPTPRSTSISWSPCAQGKNQTAILQCANLEVPRDYTEPESDETITLRLARYPATKQPCKGSIFMNTGGPGEAQRYDLLSGPAWQLLVGEDYNIVTFDPRGTGETLPFSCYNTTTERTLASIEVPTAFTASDTAIGYIWAAKQMFGETCKLQEPETGELIGTAFVARDIMKVVDALGEDGMVRYLGFSYGTALGATLAAMFPDRIDKMVLDGVLNTDQYYAGRELQEVAQSDETWAGFFKGCMEAPESLCSLKPYASSAEDLQRKIDDLIESTKFSPIPLGPSYPADLVDYNTLKSGILIGIYYPSSWPTLADAFDGILTDNLTKYLEAAVILSGTFESGSGGFPVYNGAEALQGIRCGDTAFRTDNVMDLVPTLKEFKEESWVIGDTEPVAIYMACAAWQMKAKEVYSGGFTNLKTKNPLLFVGSPFDPLTPLQSAQNMSRGFEGSALVQHDGYGHCSISQPSLCTAKAVRAYFQDGTLPDPGTVCQPSVPIFRAADLTLETILEPLNGTSKRAVKERDDDMQLLEAVEDIGRTMAQRGRPV